MANGSRSRIPDAANPLTRLSAIQKLLQFLSDNMQALLLVLLGASVTGNVFLIKEIIKVGKASDDFKSATIEYERLRGEKLEEILREEVKREILQR
jgi:hypothetical protein